MRFDNVGEQWLWNEDAGLVVGAPALLKSFELFGTFAGQEEALGAHAVGSAVLARAGFAFVGFGTAAAFGFEQCGGFEIGVVKQDFGQEVFAFLVREGKSVRRTARRKKPCK